MTQEHVRKLVRECLAAPGLSTWEVDFLGQLHSGGWITEKQGATASEIWQRRCGSRMVAALNGRGRRRGGRW